MPGQDSSLHPDDVRSRRRGHVPHISISDDNHHVTEAIGDMYGDHDYDSRRSYIANGGDDSIYVESNRRASPPTDTSLPRTLSGRHTNGIASQGRNRQTSNASLEHGSPPNLSRSSSTDTATQHFPLNDIDYESSPAAVAQELSNLQAIRRMSMNVDTADPDLPSFSSGFGPPSPPGGEEGNAGLFWVPARLHPELAPKEFKTFVDDRVDLIRRRSSSGENKGLSVDNSSALNRRRSMLSKTINSPADFQDGADVLERKRSVQERSGRSISGETSLLELESLVNDPVELARKMSIDSTRQSLEGGQDGDDMPIVPQPLGAASLKRSTRTNYRRGSLKKGERVPYSSKRAAGRIGERRPSDDGSIASPASPTSTTTPTGAIDSARPLGQISSDTASFESSSHQRNAATSQLSTTQPAAPPEDAFEDFDASPAPHEARAEAPQPSTFHSRFASNGRSTASLPAGYSPTVPSIVETPPASAHGLRQSHPPSAASNLPSRPERTSSREYIGQGHQMGVGTDRLINHAGNRRRSPQQTLDDMANNPSMMVGNSMSTDALSFIPTFDQESRGKTDKKKKDSSDSGGSKKSSWGWLLGNDDKKDKSGQHEEQGSSNKKSRSRAKLGSMGTKTQPQAPADKSGERAHDSTRLDVLHTTSESNTPRGRESLVLDRDSIVIVDDARQKSGRKSSEGRKEPGIFASLFGGKKKADRDSTAKKGHSPLRGASPNPVEGRPMQPDIDYNWTRFSILEERAIYRMAHIKLANPRRALYSQVLLSNFMYSYLAKVQQMHPQIQIPQFIQQKNSKQRQQSEPSSQDQAESQQQAAGFSAWQRYQEERLNDNAEEGSPDYADDSDPAYQQQEDSRTAQYEDQQNYDQQWDQKFYGYDNRRQQQQQQQQQQQAAGDMW